MRVTTLASTLAALAVSQAAVLSFNPVEAAAELVDSLTHPSSSAVGNPYIEIDEGYYHAESGKERKLCTLHPVPEGEGFDDDNFKSAVKECGNGGIIRLPDAN